MAIHRIVCIGCAFAMMASGAAAQVLQPPARPSRGVFGGGPPPDPNRTRQELVVQGSLQVGFDDNLAPPGVGEALAPHPSGYSGFGDSTLRYFFGNQARSLEATGRGYVNTYRNVGIGPSYGGGQTLEARAGLGRRTSVALTQSVAYAPYFSLGLFGAAPQDIGGDDRENGPANAITETGSWTTQLSGSVGHQWTRRTSMQASYAFSKQTYVDGTNFDSQMQNGTVGFGRSIGRWAGFRASYQHSDSEYDQGENTVVPLLTRTADFGFSYERRLSRTRQFAFSGGTGATYAETILQETSRPLNYWTPSGYGTFRLDVGRSWSVSGDYRRALSVLQGDTPEPFASHSGQVSLGGVPLRWLESVLTAGYSNGGSGQQMPGRPSGSYEGYTGTAQLRFRMMAGWSSVVSFTHFQYRLNEEASQALGVSRELQRNAVRVGLSWSLPLYGTYLR